MLCYQAEIEFNDMRCTFDEWPKYKDITPSGQVPLWIEPEDGSIKQKVDEVRATMDAKMLSGVKLEGDTSIRPLPQGKVFNQANAILKRLGKKSGLYSDDDIEAYEIDWLIETFNDHWLKAGYRVFLFTENPSEEELKKIADDFTALNGLIEKVLKKNGKQFLVRDNMTIGDISIYSLYSNMCLQENSLRPVHQEACANTIDKNSLLWAWLGRM